jgi:hypothetical protein
MLESKFQAKLIEELESIFEGCIILKNDANYIQGFPDLLILYNNTWAALECKQKAESRYQPNQEYYLEVLDKMSYASVIWPEIKEEVLNELQHAFRHRGPTRISKCL